MILIIINVSEGISGAIFNRGLTKRKQLCIVYIYSLAGVENEDTY